MSRAVSPTQVEPPFADVTLLPPAYVLGEERIHWYPAPPVAPVGRTISAYCVPAVIVIGDEKLATNVSRLPLLSPAIVVETRSPPVGRPPEVAQIPTVRFGFAVQV